MTPLFALFRDEKQVGEARDSEWSAGLDAHDFDGVAETKSDFGLDWCLHFRHGFEVRRIN